MPENLSLAQAIRDIETQALQSIETPKKMSEWKTIEKDGILLDSEGRSDHYLVFDGLTDIAF